MRKKNEFEMSRWNKNKLKNNFEKYQENKNKLKNDLEKCRENKSELKNDFGNDRRNKYKLKINQSKIDETEKIRIKKVDAKNKKNILVMSWWI